MRKFKNILLVCDEPGIHDALIGRAIWLAKANGVPITLVDVVDTAPGQLAGIFAALPGVTGKDVAYRALEFHRKRLAGIAAPIKSEGIETSQHVLQGIDFVEVIRKVIRDRHDLVMKGASGGSGERSLFFASADLHLLRKCPCPVWIVKRSARRRYARILAALDPDPTDRVRHTLNTLILDLATSLSKLDGSELHLVNAWRLDEEDTLRHSGFTRLTKTEVDFLVTTRRRRCERQLKGLLDRYPDDGAGRQVHFLKGRASDVIPEFAREKRVELIVMGTIGRSGIRGLIMGNTAESILNQVQCSVLAVKPPGFETPVRLDATASVGIGLSGRASSNA